jgi:hypothetical protein
MHMGETTPTQPTGDAAARAFERREGPGTALAATADAIDPLYVADEGKLVAFVAPDMLVGDPLPPIC